ncbi:MAG: division/outer membrane stress-associated lipid-binding lipoprotein [Candidatus Malihini olakiniferum]
MRISFALAALSVALLLQGCIGVAAVGTAIATKSATDPRTVGMQLDDSTLEVLVFNAIRKDQELSNEARIVATAYQGKVLLIGQAPTIDLASRAKQIAMGVDGATEVYNEIRKGMPISIGTSSLDAWITTKIRSQFLASDTVKSSNVKVITEKGEVFLLGLVTHREGHSAAELASKVSGVKQVITAFTFLE